MYYIHLLTTNGSNNSRCSLLHIGQTLAPAVFELRAHSEEKDLTFAQM